MRLITKNVLPFFAYAGETFSKKFDAAVEIQKEFIKDKWNYYAAKQVYKAALQTQIEAEQELERVKNK